MMAHIPFEIGDDFVEADESDFSPFPQHAFYEEFTAPIESDVKELAEPLKDPKESFELVMKELDGLIGLTPIKQKIREYSDYLRFVSLRKEKGFEETDRINLHAVFKGNPGTGKTTVARLLGQIYKELGLLKKGHVHEVDRGDLVAEYIGQTAPKTKEAIKKAKDGILFIDEAYSLARADDDSKDFGKEAIEVLLKELSDADDIAIVVAGYPSEMEVFLQSNPGLKSRFVVQYDFPDYTPQELVQIAEFASQKRGVNFSESAKEALNKFLIDSYRDRDRFFGNARLVNSMLDEAKINLGLRIMKTEHPEELDNQTLSTLEKADFEKIFAQKQRILPEIPIDEELLKESLNKLKGMIGLGVVKQEIEELVKLVRFYKSLGKDVRKTFSLHSVFTGNPGTGKTTVARILAQIFKALGILERGHLVECDRQSLVGGYVGQTAIKTTDMINKSMGGVLFIDEAYSLTDGGSSDYGREAVETILKRMEDQRGEFIVIAAGYSQNMERFMESNPGLKSRFDRIFHFEDFTAEDLYVIAMNQLHDQNIIPEPKAADHLMRYIDFMYKTRDKYFGNGRSVRRVIEESIRNQHLRLASLDPTDRKVNDVETLTFEDVEEFNTVIKPNYASGGIGFKL
jgi:SpoVK/Ycf46/Vps4 family AAA+-type ATPase